MATISSQSTRHSARTVAYVCKGPVAISAIGGTVQRFEAELAAIRTQWGKDGVKPVARFGDDGRVIRDADGRPVIATDAHGNTLYEAKYVQAYSLVQSFSRDELDPDDPDSWSRAQELGRAVAETVFPGRPVLIATEVSGRSGCVHNHIVVGAIDPATGKSLDSGVVSAAGLQVTHDHILTNLGHQQPADMAIRTEIMERDLEEAEKRARLRYAGEAPSRIERRVAVARSHVKVPTVARARYRAERDRALAELPENAGPAERDAALSGAKARTREANSVDVLRARQERAEREYERYLTREHDRELARDVGAPLPPERFSELELAGRARDAVADTRWTTIEELGQLARDEYRVTITPRGRDVSFGMMRESADGTLAEPARGDIRRGSRLGDRLRVDDLEAAGQRNRNLAEQARREQTRPGFRSQLHDLDTAAMMPDERRAVEGLARLEDSLGGRAPASAGDRADLENDLRRIGIRGTDTTILDRYGDCLSPQMGQALQQRTAWYDARGAAASDAGRLSEAGQRFPAGSQMASRYAEQAGRARSRAVDIDTGIRAGDWGDPSRDLPASGREEHATRTTQTRAQREVADRARAQVQAAQDRDRGRGRDRER